MIRRSSLKPCGTPAAYRRHLRDGQTPCEACREAENVRVRKGRPPKREAACGTRSGYMKHLRNREEPCAECRAAQAAHHAERRREGATRTDIPHGLNGYGNYGCRCEVCRAAKSARNRADRERRAREAAAAP